MGGNFAPKYAPAHTAAGPNHHLKRWNRRWRHDHRPTNAHFRELTREVGVPRSLVTAYEEPARRKPTAFWLVHFGKRQTDQMAKKFYYCRDALEFRNLVQECGWKARIISGEELA